MFVVDDDEDARSALSLTLQLHGWHTGEFASGDACRAALAHCVPERIVSDLHMPRGSGLDLLRGLQGLGLASRLIIVTAEEERAAAVEALRRAGTPVLFKPLAVDALLQLLGEPRTARSSGSHAFERNPRRDRRAL